MSLRLILPRRINSSTFSLLTRSVSTTQENADRNAMLDRMIRVDHAGEYGANVIYAGQMAVLGSDPKLGPLIQHMWDQEKHHLATFEKMMPEHKARPSALLPFWHVAGFALGAGTALLGKEAAMACTVAVETAICDHYNKQLRTLEADTGADHSQLMKTISQFRDEEQEHHDIGIEHDAELAPAYQLLKGGIQLGCVAAIWVAERV